MGFKKFNVFVSAFLLTLSACEPCNAAQTGVLQAARIRNGSGYLNVPSVSPTASRACRIDSNGTIASSSISDTELATLLNIDSNVQDQLDAKQDALGFTAVSAATTVNGHALSSNVTVSKSDVGLGNVLDAIQEVPLTFSAPLLRSVNTITCIAASGAANGCLSSTDWSTFNGKQAALGYTAENSANKDTDGTLAANSDTKYPSQKAVKTYADTKEPALGFTAVPNTRTVAGHALSTNVSITASDVGLGNVANTAQVTSVGANAPITTTGGTTPTIACTTATGSVAGCLAAADFATFNAKEPAITAGTTLEYLRADKSKATLNTSVVPESGNLYHTDARTIAAPLTGFSSGAGTVSASDTVLTAVNKIVGNASKSTRINVIETFDDFTGDISGSSAGSAGDSGWTPVKGAGAGTLVSQIGGNAAAGNPGIISLNTGSTGAANASAALRKGLAALILGGGSYEWEANARLPVLSTATEQFDCRIGLASTNLTADATNGVYVQYAPTDTFRFSLTTVSGSSTVTIGAVVGTDVIDNTSIQVGMGVTHAGLAGGTTVSSVNTGAGTMVVSANATGNNTATGTFTVGDYLSVKTATASTRTKQVTNTKPVAATFFKVGATTNAAGTSTTFVIGGTNYTVGTNHPTIAITPIFGCVKNTSSGATTSVLDADYYYQKHTLTNLR